jgi:hypothetical protein
MHQDVVNVILAAAPQRIVYVSCNPATQARDLSLLDQDYRVISVQPVDISPQTSCRERCDDRTQKLNKQPTNKPQKHPTNTSRPRHILRLIVGHVEFLRGM